MRPPAKFLVLFDAAPRALLLDSTSRLLGEVIEDDGFIVDHLLAHARPCPLPDPGALDAMVPPPSAQWPVRCFELA